MLTLPMHKLALGLFVEIDLHLSETYASTRLSLTLSFSRTHTHIHRDMYTGAAVRGPQRLQQRLLRRHDARGRGRGRRGAPEAEEAHAQGALKAERPGCRLTLATKRACRDVGWMHSGASSAPVSARRAAVAEARVRVK